MWCVHRLFFIVIAYGSLGFTLRPHLSEHDRLLEVSGGGWQPHVVSRVIDANDVSPVPLTMRVHTTGNTTLDAMLIAETDSALAMARQYLSKVLHVRVPHRRCVLGVCKCADFDANMKCGDVSLPAKYVCKSPDHRVETSCRQIIALLETSLSNFFFNSLSLDGASHASTLKHKCEK